MREKQIFDKYNRRLVLEGILKSAVIGFTIGLALGAAFALVASLGFNNFATIATVDTAVRNMILISLGITLVGTVAAMPILYFAFFRSNSKLIAKRVDRLGLEERLITMQELESDDSYLAMVQREDAKEHLAKTSPKRLKIRPFMLVPTILMVVLVGTFIGATVTTAAAFEDPLEWNRIHERRVSGEEVVLEELFCDTETEFVIVFYFPMSGGYIQGDMFQVIVSGGDSRAVLAVGLPGMGFFEWFGEPLDCPQRIEARRQEREVEEERDLPARFEPEGPGGDEPSDPDET